MDEKIAKYFLVKVEFESETDSGKPKKIKSQYLVDSQSCTEAEAKMVAHLDGTMLDFEIVSTAKSPIEDVIDIKTVN